MPAKDANGCLKASTGPDYSESAKRVYWKFARNLVLSSRLINKLYW
jgi:hypothetical protein